MSCQINLEEVIRFFDHCAPNWDKTNVRNEPVIRTILDNGGIGEGCRVLDVACGTGVLFEDYLGRNVERLVGVDVSPEMIRIARSKFTDPRLEILCGDIRAVDTGKPFDCCMIYNAFPHFADPQGLIRLLAGKLVPGGRLSVAHGLSRAQLARHHSGAAHHVSMELPEAETLAEMFEPWFDVDVCISNDEMYQVAGRRKWK